MAGVDRATDEAEPVDPYAEFEARRFYGRGDVEFGRSLAYFDATFAIATTLLVTTLDPGQQGWSSWSGFSDAMSGPLLAFTLSFVVVSTFWWANHRFVSTLERLSARFVVFGILMLAFVVLVPFTTEGIGVYGGDAGQVSTICYALNIAAVSLSAFALFRVALCDGLYHHRPPPGFIVEKTVGMLDTPVVFLLSILIALWSPNAARYSWLLLIATGVISRRWSKRRHARAVVSPEA